MTSAYALDPASIATRVEEHGESKYAALSAEDREAAKAADMLECFLGDTQRLVLNKLGVPAAMVCAGDFSCPVCHPASNACKCEAKKQRVTLVDVGQFHHSPACVSQQSPYPLVAYSNPSLGPSHGPLGYVQLCGCTVHISVVYMCSDCRAQSDWKDESLGAVRVRHRALPRR